uniref:Uncharacterized protein n=1 Tax=Acrosorium ciliolatum TaxID=1550622 RepID=A0A1Z1M2S8_9FLOR|nr:hypothetical protein [Acrosorium ciliolatum]ARW60094.1 hypothetical protein [Acrosorium ciliolatum]
MKYIRYSNHKESCNFLDTIIYISLIYEIIHENLLNKISIEIINEYRKSKKSYIAIQYINKFNYIYNKTYEYYYNYNYYELDKTEIAMTTLYIISQIQKQNSIYFLIKFFYK